MAILVTGGTGFVGLNLIEALLARGDSVVIRATDHCPRWRSLSSRVCRGLLILVTGYVRAARLVADAVRCQAIERIVQGTAVTADRQREASSPAFIFEVNPLGLVHILEVARGGRPGGL